VAAKQLGEPAQRTAVMVVIVLAALRMAVLVGLVVALGIVLRLCPNGMDPVCTIVAVYVFVVVVRRFGVIAAGLGELRLGRDRCRMAMRASHGWLAADLWHRCAP
jgi:hypothetical protein